jgi:TolB protein
MIKRLVIIALIFSFKAMALDLSIGAKKHQAMPLVLGVIGNSDSNLKPLIDQMVRDLEFSKQFKVQVVPVLQEKLTKDVLQKIASQKYALALFINSLPDQDHTKNFEWRLYDLLDLKMLVGKKVSYQGDFHQAAHLVCNKIWQQLMGCETIFNSMIVACQKIKNHQKNHQYIYGFHPTNGTEFKVPLVETHTINLAPRWHPTKRLLYYSQHTPQNVRLMCINEHGRKKIVTNFEGLNLTPAISPKGQIIVSLSSSGCEKLYRYDYDSKRNVNKFTALTDPHMHAISPSFIDEERVVFCAIDAKTKLPRIAILNIFDRSATFLTGKAFCVSPVYTPTKNKIAYCKKINGVQQIFCYDLTRNQHEQLTTSLGDKDDCSWSPCGNYLVFTQQQGKESRIALFSMLDRQITYLSPKGESWCFPAWSPCYGEQLFVSC